jgi:rod shape determining protein RodA
MTNRTKTTMSFSENIKTRLIAFLRNFDFLHFAVVCLLAATGLVFVYGIGQQIGGKVQNYWKMQALWVCMGFALWIFFSFVFNPKNLRVLSPLIYLSSVILLIAVLVQGVEINSAKSWISIAGFRFQPSEFAKVALVLMLAWVLTLRNFNVNRFFGVLTIAVVTAIPFLLICLEPDLGTAMVIIPMVFFMIFAAKLSWKWMLAAAVALLITIPSSYPFLKDYQKERIRVFLDPQRDPKDRGWNSLQSQLAVGSGGISGKGFMQGTQHTLGFLPQTVSNTDFIFSVIGEETGFVGSSSVVLLYFLLCASLLRTAAAASDPFGKFVTLGVIAVIFAHSFINIAMTIKLLPVTGLPLPLISYGGSFTVVSMAMLGMANSAYYRRSR